MAVFEIFSSFIMTPQKFVSSLSAKCLGFHFSDSKSLGKTTHAFLARHNELEREAQEAQKMAIRARAAADEAVADDAVDAAEEEAAALQAEQKADEAEEALRNEPPDAYTKIVIEISGDKSIVNLKDTAINKRAVIALVKSINSSETSNRITQVDLAALTSPVLINVKGSAVDSITTLCRIKGYLRLTPEFYTCELEIMSALLREAELIGKSHTKNTVAKRLSSTHLHPSGRRLGVLSLQDLLNVLRMNTRPEFGIALASVFKAMQVVRRGFLDSGKLFRDNSSRSLAADAYRESLYNILNIVL